jgi:hypothetical protein
MFSNISLPPISFPSSPNCAMALEPGGCLICQVPNASSGIASRWRYGDWTHHCSFSETSLDFVLYNAGFTVNIIHGGRSEKPTTLPLHFATPGQGTWLLYRLFHTLRRLEYMVELGSTERRPIPLTPNYSGDCDAPLKPKVTWNSSHKGFEGPAPGSPGIALKGERLGPTQSSGLPSRRVLQSSRAFQLPSETGGPILGDND